MSSRKEYNLQKGLQAKQLNEDVAKPLSPRSSANRNNHTKEVARIRETCPPGTPDERIALILQQTKGDSQKIQLAISELWENAGAVQDEWATVPSKKQPKKKNDERPTTAHYRQKEPNSNGGDTHVNANTSGPASGRGRGSTRGGRGPQGIPTGGRDASRGGRGGRGGRGRSAPANSRNEQDDVEPVDDDESEYTNVQTHTDVTKSKQVSQKQPEAIAPLAPTPVLSGAWAKTPNFVKQVKPASPKKVSTPKAVPTHVVVVEKPQSPKKQPSTPKWDVSKDTKLESSTPTVHTPSKSSWPTTPATAVETQQVQAWPRSPKKEEPEVTKLEPEATIASWGASLESSKPKGSNDWDSAPASWSRSSPILNPALQYPPASPKANFSPKASVKSPKSPNQASFSASPKAVATETLENKFSMGRWEAVVEPELSLQFGSFSMDMDNASGSANWSSSTSAPNTSGWPAASPKKNQDSIHTPVKSPRAIPSTTSAPPGLSDSPKHSPRKFQNPPPNAPSPAALPKPDDVKQRQQTTASRGVPQQQQQTQQQFNTPQPSNSQQKLNSTQSFSSPLYQNPSTFNQYTVGMSASRSQGPTSTQSAQPTTPSSSGGINHLQGTIGKQHTPHGSRSNPSQTPVTSSTAGTGGINQSAQISANSNVPSGGVPPTNHPANVNAPQQQPPHVAPYQQMPHSYHPQYAPPPPPGMAMPYNPYNYNQYYPQQGYPHGYYQNPQYPQYSPRQFPPRGNIPYGMESAPGFSNPQNVPLGYQEPSQIPHPSEYGQGFGDLGYGQFNPQVPHHHLQQTGKQGPPLSANGRPVDPSNGYNAGQASGASREHTSSPPVPAGQNNPGSYGQHYGGNWQGSYNQPPQQPIGGWGGHQQPPHQQPMQGYPPHQASYRPYNGVNTNNETGNQNAWSS